MKKITIGIISAILLIGACTVLYFVLKPEELENKPKEPDTNQSSDKTLEEKIGDFYKDKKAMGLKSIKYSEFELKMKNKDVFIIVFVKTGCPACEMYEPVFKDYLVTSKQGAYILDIANITNDQLTNLIENYNLKNTPTTYLFYGSDEIDRFVGNKGSEFIDSWFIANKLK